MLDSGQQREADFVVVPPLLRVGISVGADEVPVERFDRVRDPMMALVRSFGLPGSSIFSRVRASSGYRHPISFRWNRHRHVSPLLQTSF